MAMMTVLEVLTAATDYLKKHGVESPRLHAEHLLAKTLGKRRLDLYLEFDRPLGESERAPLREEVRRRAEGIPLQHLLGTVEFMGHTFLSDARALIPRPETEQLLEWVKADNVLPQEAVLDVGTGSGVIAITLALAYPQRQIVATDLSEQALALARENAEKLDATVHFSQADLFPSLPEKVGVVVANLPYIPSGEIASLSREVQHDPLQALDGGPDGLRILARLIENMPERLLPQGRLYLEIGMDQVSAVHKLLENAQFQDIQVRCDYQGIERFVSAWIE